MQCRLTSNRILALCNMTKEEQVVEDSKSEEEPKEMVEDEDQSLAITMDNKDIMPKNVISPSQYVSSVNLMIILWKTTLFYKETGRIRYQSRKI